MNDSELFKTKENITKSNKFIADALISKIRNIAGSDNYITDEEVFDAINLAYVNGYYDCKGQILVDNYLRGKK